jgi:cbb3-type cytochrome oxidase maturation protein
MSVLYIVLPLALLIAAAAVIAFIWATRSGQFDDLDTPAVRMLHDDTPTKRDREKAEESGEEDSRA